MAKADSKECLMDSSKFAGKFDKERLDMVEHQVKKRGVKDAGVLKAMQRVPRKASLLKKSLPLSQRIYEAAEPFNTIEGVDLSAFLDRVGDKRVVLLGEASHGSHEFYKMRAFQ